MNTLPNNDGAILDEILPIMVPAPYLRMYGYEVGDRVRMELKEHQVDVITGSIDGELFVLDGYEEEFDMFTASRIPH